MSTAKTRLLDYLRHLGIGQQKFEKSIGMSNGWCSKSGDSIRASTLEKIQDVYPELNISWLVSGVGNMLNTPGKNEGTLDMNAKDTTNSINTQVAGNGNHVNNTNGTPVDRFLDELAAQMEITRETQKQLDKSQEQMDRLISIIEQLNK